MTGYSLTVRYISCRYPVIRSIPFRNPRNDGACLILNDDSIGILQCVQKLMGEYVEKLVIGGCFLVFGQGLLQLSSITRVDGRAAFFFSASGNFVLADFLDQRRTAHVQEASCLRDDTVRGFHGLGDQLLLQRLQAFLQVGVC